MELAARLSGCNGKFACMGVDFRATRGRVEARYPFFKSTTAEREALFGRSKGDPERFDDAGAPTPRDDALKLDAELSSCA